VAPEPEPVAPEPGPEPEPEPPLSAGPVAPAPAGPPRVVVVSIDAATVRATDAWGPGGRDPYYLRRQAATIRRLDAAGARAIGVVTPPAGGPAPGAAALVAAVRGAAAPVPVAAAGR